GYANSSGGWYGTLLYNVAGKRILEAGSGGLPDAYEQPRHMLDFSLQLPVVATISLKLDARNLLDAPYRMTQGDVLRSRYKSGRQFDFAFTWHL
ncbi:MAG TPA: hypothetical protein VFX42_06245, partial [Gemmatimonadales bacterium]|nr:hypothetical protein [Gemmatimonadales bacterium]